MTRGYVFTIDALLALVIAAAFLTSLAALGRADTQSTDMLRLMRNSADAASVLQTNGTLDAALNQSDEAAATGLDAALVAILPPGLSGRMDVDVYEYRTGTCGTCSLDGSSPIGGFCHCRSFNTSLTASNRSTSASSMHVAYNNSVPTMMNVQVKVWAP